MWVPRVAPAYLKKGFLVGPASSHFDQRSLIGPASSHSDQRSLVGPFPVLGVEQLCLI